MDKAKQSYDTYQTTVIILCINVNIFPVSNNNGTSMTIYLWPEKKYIIAILIIALCILGCVMALSFRLFSISSNTISPSLSRFTLPSEFKTSLPKYCFNSFHALVPGSKTNKISFFILKGQKI